MGISSETIYACLRVLPRGELKRELLKALRQGGKRRHERTGECCDRRKKLEAMAGIEDRPSEAAGRKTPGHREGGLSKERTGDQL